MKTRKNGTFLVSWKSLISMKAVSLFVLFILVSSIFVAAQNVERENCGFWCKFGKFLFGTGEEEKALAGKAGGIWGDDGALVGKVAEEGELEEPAIIGPEGKLTAEEISVEEREAEQRGESLELPEETTSSTEDAFSRLDEIAEAAEEKARKARQTFEESENKIDEIEDLLEESKDYSTESDRDLWDIALGLGVNILTGEDEIKSNEELRKDIKDKIFLLEQEKITKESNLDNLKKQAEGLEKEAEEARKKADGLKPSLQELYESADRRATALEAKAKELSEKAADAKNAYDVAVKGIGEKLEGLEKDDTEFKINGNTYTKGEEESFVKFKERIKKEELKREEAIVKEAKEKAAKANEEAETARKKASELRWRGSFWSDLSDETWGEGEFYETKGWKGLLLTGDNPLGYTLGGALRLTAKMGKYRGFSNLIMPEVTQQWFEHTNDAFFREMDVVGRVTKEVCDYDDRMMADIPGQNAVFIETAGESYQFVGRIQAERSASPTYILCHPEEKTCPNDFVCRDDLCYKEDEETPAKGYLYKIEWGVTAPRDEKFTPFIDENSKAVKFNVMIKYKNRDVWLYKREGAITKEVIELENGESDSSMWLKYLGGEADEVCIMFSDKYYSVDRYGRKHITEICASIEPLTAGSVEFGGTTPSQKVSSGEITETTDIW